MEVIVIGGGVAGMISASVLTSLGMRVTLIDNGFAAKPQWDHIHFLDDECWLGLCELVPGFEEELIFSGAHRGVEVLVQQGLSSSGEARVRPSRRLIDKTLLKALPEGVVRVSGRVTSVDLNQFGSQVILDDGRKYCGAMLIDASGRSRVSLDAIARILGTQASLHQGPAGGSYASVIVEGLKLPDDQIARRTRYQDTDVLLLKEEENRWRLTLQMEGNCSQALAVEKMQKILSSSTKSPNLFSGAAMVDGPFLFGAVRAEYLECCDNTLEGIPWVMLGDALLTTPPWLGWGIDQLTKQVQLLRDGFLRYRSIEDIRDSINENARNAWLQATMKETLRGLLAA